MMKENRRDVSYLVDEIVDKIKTTAEQRTCWAIFMNSSKHIYSVCKMRDKASIRIYDLIAIRCVMETHSDIYAMLDTF